MLTGLRISPSGSYLETDGNRWEKTPYNQMRQRTRVVDEYERNSVWFLSL
jgi:hypothetical protein